MPAKLTFQLDKIIFHTTAISGKAPSQNFSDGHLFFQRQRVVKTIYGHKKIRIWRKAHPETFLLTKFENIKSCKVVIRRGYRIFDAFYPFWQYHSLIWETSASYS